MRSEKLEVSGGQEPVIFHEITDIKDATPTAHLTNPEPSVAENGQTVMTTGNFWMSLSKDGGATFASVNPTTIFPQDYGGFCCDQVVLHDNKIGSEVGIDYSVGLQYRPFLNNNAVITFGAAALTDLDPSDLADATFLEALIPAALSVRLADGEQKVQPLRLAR